MAEVITQNNINDVVKAVISNNTIAENVLTGTIKSIVRIADSSKVAENSMKTLNNLEKVIKSYSAVVSNVIDMLCNSKDNKNLSQLLGRIRETDEVSDNRIVETTRFTVVDSAMQIPNIISSLFKVIENTLKFKGNFKTIMNVKRNIFLLKLVIKDLLNDLTNTFNELSNEDAINKIIKSLVKQPDTIYSITGEQKHKDLKAENITETKQGQLGLLDVFDRTFSIVGLLNNLNVPNLIVFEVKLIKMRTALNRLYKHILGFTDKKLTEEILIQMDNFGVLIAGDGNKKIGLTTTIENLKNLIEKIVEIENYSKFINRFNKTTSEVINSVLEKILKLIYGKTSPVSKLSTATVKKRIDNAIKNIDALSELIDSIAKLSGKNARLLLARLTIKILVKTINVIIDTLNSNLLDKNINTDKTKFENIKDIIDSLLGISIKIIALGVLAIPASVAALVSCIFILSLIPLFASVNLLSNSLSNRKTKGIRRGLRNMAGILASLLIVGTALIGLALMAPIFVFAMIKGIVPLIIAMVLLTGFMWLSFKLIGRLSITTVPNILAFGAAIAIIMGTLVLSGLVILATAKIAELIGETQAVGNIILLLLGMIALTTVIVLLGLGVSLLAPIFIPAMLGFGQLLMLIGMILGMGLLINLVADINIKTDDAKGKIDQIFDVVKYLRTKLNEEIGNKKTWRKDKKILRQVDKTVKEISDIAEKLNYIQTIKLNEVDITGNVTNIFNLISKIDKMMEQFNSRKVINPDVENTNKLISFKERRQNKRRIRQNKKILSKIDKVINRIDNIADSLISISEFTLDETIKSQIISNIDHIFECIERVDTEIKLRNAALTITKGDSGEEIKDIVTLRKERRLARQNKKIARQNKKQMTKIGSIMETLVGVIDAVESIKEFEWDITDKQLTKKVDIIFKSINQVSAAITKNNNIPNKAELKNLQPLIDYLCEFSDSTKELAEINSDNLKKNIDNYVKFVDKINSIEVNKLETSAKMFQQMANFSNSIKGDFDRLAESLGEKLVPVLENLREILQEIPDKLDDGFQNTSASIAATTAPATRENITAQVNRENPSMTPEEVTSMVDQRMAEKAKSESTGVAAKLDELISLLKGYGSENVIVQTI